MKQITKQIITGTFLATAASFVSTHAFAESDNLATVNATNLNIREQPTTQGKVVGTVKQGTTVQVLSQEKEWAKISHDGKEGYVSLQFLKLSGKTPGAEQQQPTINNGQKEEGIVTATRLNVRNSPVLGSSMIGYVQKNEKVTVLGKANGWAKIEYKGKEGYVSLEFLKFGDAIQTPDASSQKQQQPTIKNGAEETGTINATSLRVRSAANTSSAVLGNLKNGEKVTVLGKANGWAKISYQGKEGYVSLEFVKLEAGKQEEKPAENITNGTQEIGIINATSLRVRSTANTSSAVLGNLKNGEKVTVLGKANGWAKINYQGKEGYVSLEFVKLEAGKQEEKPAENITNGTQEVGKINATSLRVRSAANTS
ncbi:SH3 domain-containing protein, partial [Bacillus paramycoides]|uniref:SH3 domain-containing protein n=1 Tax=Bacillus paramycoides TaxID=2026194 RepID=UPI0013F4F6D7